MEEVQIEGEKGGERCCGCGGEAMKDRLVTVC